MSCLLLAMAVLSLPGNRSRLDTDRRCGPRSRGAGLSLPPEVGAGRSSAVPVGWWMRSGWIDKVIAAVGVCLFAPAVAVAGPAGVFALIVLTVTAVVLVRRAVAAHRRKKALVQVQAAVRLLGRELRSGADPGTAASRAAPAARGEGVNLLQTLGDVVQAGDRFAGQPMTPLDIAGSSPGSYALTRLAGCSRLTARYGVALTPMIDALARDLAGQRTVDEQRAGQLAGPRTSGYVLAALPVLGVALGIGMGADPVGVLFGTAVGNLLLAVGVSLNCLGLLWAARIVGR